MNDATFSGATDGGQASGKVSAATAAKLGGVEGLPQS